MRIRKGRDVLTPEQRHECMSNIKNMNTKPEIIIASILTELKFKFETHNKKLPGKPDFVLPEYGSVIFVHGCFWHMHNCHLFKWPSTRKNFWRKKIEGNASRDIKHLKMLKTDGWYVMTIWECALKGKKKLSVEKLANDISIWLKYGLRNKTIIGKI